ncbi:MAG TPA: T9SS type A sorting domain-containing protein, partial [Chitinophagaceae bacterium]
PFRFLDKYPFTGNNYYRIKSVDKNGEFTYSKVINVINKPFELTILLYPNPVINELNIGMKNFTAGNVNIIVTDMRGRIFYNQPGRAGDISINTSAWPAQLYILKVLNSSHEILGIQKFVRH